MRALIWSAVACGSGGPPQAWRRSLWMTPCGWPVRWFQAPTRPFNSLRRAASASRLTGASAPSAAATALVGLRVRVMALPGNHDVGDEPPGQDPDQIIDADRLARWDRSFAADRWVLDAGSWRLVGVNAQLFGSGLAREHAQDQWLDEQLSTAGRPIALFLHKPLFVESPTDDVASPACMGPSARARLLDKLNRSDVRLIVSGHLHQHRDRTIGGQRHLWVPAVAFAAAQAHGGDGRCGVTVLDFSQDSVEVTVERPHGLVSHDLNAIKGHGRYRFLRDMPPSPPPQEG